MISCDSIIFDVDGTLWDCTETAVKAYNETIAAACMDYRLTADDLRRNFGKPMREIGLNLLNGVYGDENLRMMNRILQRQDTLLSEEPPAPYPDVCSVIAGLSASFPLFIISNCQAGYIERFMNVTGTVSFITDHSCPDDTGLLKAGNITLMSKKHSLRHPVYVGDTKGDEKACRDAGVPFIYAAYGFGKAENPDAVIESFSELPLVVEKIK